MMLRTHLCPYSERLIITTVHKYWGGWGETWERPWHPGPCTSRHRDRSRRSPARACRVDRARTKRRRFIHAMKR